MNKNVQKTCLIAIVLFSFLVGMQLASAAIYYSPTYANVSENFMLNVTISAPALTGNITQVTLIDATTGAPPFGVDYSSNGSSISTPGVVYFSPVGLRMVWHNLTSAGIVQNSTNISFTIWMNNTIAGAPSNYKIIACIYNQTDVTTFATRACDTTDPFFVGNQTMTIGMNFGFSGYVKNDTGILQPGTNVTIYEYAMNLNGPPSEIPLASAITDSNGMFRLWGINGSKEMYKMRLVHNNSVRATLVGPTLPGFPSNMFYPTPVPPEMPMFKKKPVINGSTFYLQPAATINISAIGNVTSIPVRFGYELIDQAVGFPIESNIRESLWSKEIVVPIGRSYTVMIVRDPQIFLPYDWCYDDDVPLMNDTACPSPPMTMDIESSDENMIQGGYKNVVINLSYSMHYLSGCLDVSGNTSTVNLTYVISRLIPWEGFVPPIDAKISNFNTTNYGAGGNENLNYSDARCPNSWAFYNMSMMGSSSGIKYLIEFYARNAFDNSGSGNGEVDLAMFQNVTMYEEDQWVNITLKPLAGSFYGVVTSGNAANTTKMKIFVQNSSGSAITNNMHVELKVKHPVFGTLHYIIEDLSNGITYVPILANSTWAKVSVYSNEAPPVEKTLNLNLAQNNITLQVGEMTFRKPLANGSLEYINVSNKNVDATTGINMTFYRNSEGCNTPNPPASCLLTQMDANDFNPMAVMMAGKVNLELKMTGSGTALYFINFDLFSAKPPTNSIMSNNASRADTSAQTQVWEQGSFVPHVYDYAFVVMPYNATAGATDYINESFSSFNISLSHLRDENWAVVWNKSTNSTAQLPDEYTDFNTGIYAPLLTTAGVACSTTNTTDVCYWNKDSNYFALKVPHFSGLGSTIAGIAPSETTTSTTDSGTSSTSGGATEATVTETRTFSNIAADSENTYRVSKADSIGVDALIFTTTEALENVKVAVTKLAEKPSSVSQTPEGGVYRYFEIDAPKLVGKLKEARIQFIVTTKWMEDNDYEPEHIRLARFADGSWRELTTSIINEETSKVYYEAISPGFSYFAIIAKKSAEEEAPASNVTAPAETPIAPELPPTTPAEEAKESSIVKTLFIVIGILVVLFLAVLGYRKKHVLVFWREPTDKERQQYLRKEFLNRKKQQSWGGGSD